MDIETFTYELIDSKMYILMENSSVIIIDPNLSDDANRLLKSKCFDDIMIVLTHEHYDHISGVEKLRQEFNCVVYCSKKCHQNMQSSIKNGSKYFKALFMDKEPDRLSEAEKILPFVSYGDVVFEDKKEFAWEGHNVVLIETPGHSSGSICIQVDDKYLFTGDSLLKGTKIITRLPGGSKKEYGDITFPYLQSLDKNLYVYPGHGEAGYLRDFKYVNCTLQECYL